YARLDDRLADPVIKQRAKAALLAEADFGIGYLEANAFNLTATHRDMPYHWGLYGSPDAAITLIRADYLTDGDRYLQAALLAANYSAGANPMNTTFMSGLGHQFPLNIHHIDSRRTGQDPPRGVPVYGQYDPKDNLAQDDSVRWPIPWVFDPRNIPAGTDWPANEAYFDVFSNIAHNEFTVHQSQRPSVHVWGYLAARPR
ncbi:MAG: glycoside hydrolase family 9 protein, partial [Planctomycetota bacterium]